MGGFILFIVAGIGYYIFQELNRLHISTNPPPNFAKVTDTRYGDYIARYCHESWELDALNPKVIAGLIKDAVDRYTDQTKRQELIGRQEADKHRLAYIADHWQEITLSFPRPN